MAKAITMMEGNPQALARLALDSAYPPFDLQLTGKASVFLPLMVNSRLRAAASSLGLAASDARDAHRRATGVVMATNVRLGGVGLRRLCFRLALVLMVFKAFPVLALGRRVEGEREPGRDSLSRWVISTFYLYVPNR